MGASPVVEAMSSPVGRWHASPLGMPVAGLLWSLATLLAQSEQVDALGITKAEAFFYITLGGMAQTLLLWVGFTFVLWAMTRAFGGRIELVRLLLIVSGASLALWAGAPAAVFWIGGGAWATAFAAVCLITLAFFLHAITKALSIELSWPMVRATGAVTAASVFLASFAFLAL